MNGEENQFLVFGFGFFSPQLSAGDLKDANL